jgi:hypothetical protein
MSTIRKTISISSKDPKLQEVINNVPNYEVSHVIRQLMYDGLKYRSLIEKGLINDIEVQITPTKQTNIVINEEKEQKSNNNEEKTHIIEEKQQKTLINEENKQIIDNFDDFEEEIDINSIELEEIEENDEDLEDLLLSNG